MEQFLKNFFNDNSLCVGLCDLSRKTDEILTANVYKSENLLKPQAAPEYIKPQQKIEEPQIQKAKQTLAQYFLAQQQEYAEKQKVLQQNQMQNTIVNQTVKHVVNSQPQDTLKKQAENSRLSCAAQYLNSKPNNFVPQKQEVKNIIPKTTTIIEGSRKKVISAAVPTRIVGR